MPSLSSSVKTALANSVLTVTRKALEQCAPSGPRLVSIKQCRIGYRTALAAIKDGTLPAFRVGRTTFIRVEDEDDWIIRTEHRVHQGQVDDQGDEPDEIGELIEISRGVR